MCYFSYFVWCRDYYNATPMDRLSEDEEDYSEIVALLEGKTLQKHTNEVSTSCMYVYIH